MESPVEKPDDGQPLPGRTELRELRRMVERGVFPPTVGGVEAVEKTALKVLVESQYERNRIAAGKLYASLMAHNLKTLVWLEKIDRDDLGGNEDDIVFLPESGPWDVKNADTKAVEESDQKGECTGE